MRSRVMYVGLIAAVMTVGLVSFAQAGPQPIADVPRFAGVWVDQTLGMITAFFPEGIFTMTSLEMPDPTPLAGNWGVVRGRFVLRTIVGREGQIWSDQWSAPQKAQLINGGYDLTAIAEVGLQGGNLVGTLRTWSVTFGAGGRVETFKAWDDPTNHPIPITWEPVYRVYPMVPQVGGELPEGMEEVLPSLVVGGSQGGDGVRPKDTLPMDDWYGDNPAQ